MTSNKRKIGDKLEDYVIKKLGPDFHKTGNSGATYKDGDIRHRKLVVECKVKNSTEGFAAPLSELRKLWKLADEQGKDWLYIEQNADGKVMVLMELNHYAETISNLENKIDCLYEDLANERRLDSIE